MQKKLLSAVTATIFTVALAMVGVASAATTIGSNISTGGTVGVSTSTPAQTLGVQGNSYVSGTALFGGAVTATSTITVQSTTATSTVSTGGLTVGTSQLVVQQNSGRVGIGSSTPMYAFAIQNTATPQAAFAYDAANYLTLSTGANGTTTLTAFGGAYASLIAASPLRVASTSAFALEVRDGSDNNILVVNTSSRTLGVSTSTPALTFSVQGNSYFAGTALFSGAVTATSTLAVQSTTATSTFSTGGLTVGTSQLVVQQTSGRVGVGSTTPMSLFVVDAPAGLAAFEVGSSTGSVLKVDSTQRVGIGTSTPVAKLSVDAPAALDAFAVGSSTATVLRVTQTQRVAIGSTSTPYSLLSVDAPAGLSAFEVGSSTGSVLKVDSTQRVGIGSSTPSATLSVNAPTGQDSFAVGSSTNPILIIKQNMRVGIGTTSPLARFSVDAGGTATTTVDLGKVCFRSITTGGTTIFWYLRNNDAGGGMGIATTTDTACGF